MAAILLGSITTAGCPTVEQDNMPTAITPSVAALRKYLSDRDIPLTTEYLTTAGLELAGAERIAEVLGFHLRDALGVVIKYPGTDYVTVRLLKGGPRCPKGITPHAYLAPPTNWNTVSGTLVICESPLKALTWSRHGYNALSAGGVTTVYMPRKGEWCEGFPHAALESGAIDTVLLAWDSDIVSNHNVAKAQRVLARALMDRHPAVTVKVHVLPPPPEDFGKDSWGCDDFHHYYGEDAFREWAGEISARVDPERDELKDHLDELSAKYVACLTPERVINLNSGAMHTEKTWCSFVEPHRVIPGERNPIPVAPIWMRRADRPTVVGVDYLPGGETIEGDKYNLWKPSGVLPIKGDVGPWLTLIHDAVHEEQIRTLMLQCMAYQVQNRSKRLEKLLYFVGRHVGTGKSTQARIMQRILGEDNTGWITRTELEGSFNACWAAKELVVMDDIEKLKRDTWSKIKTHITSDVVSVSEKYMPVRAQENYATFYVTANQADVLTTDADDRRVLMIPFEPSVLHRASDDPYWRDFYRWLDKEGGLQAIAHYLATYDLSGFDPQFYPPDSEIKEEAVDANMEEDEAFLIDFLDNAAAYVPAERKVITSTELYTLATGEVAESWNANSRRVMGQKISARMYLKRVTKRQISIGGQRCRIYWVPGCSGRNLPPSTGAEEFARANISKYPIKL